jgi:outer membrane protein
LPELSPSAHTITLSDAKQAALQHHPNIRQAQANSAAAEARVDQAGSAYLPQVTATGSYQRITGNYAPRPGATPSAVSSTSWNFNTYNYYSMGVSATQLLYDFGQTSSKKQAAEASFQATRASESVAQQQSLLSVQSAFFSARAQKQMMLVTRDSFNNQRRHLEQIVGFVRSGIRPEIDLVQARADLANVRVLVINAQNSYDLAKVQLNQAMGIIANTEYEVADEWLTALPEENASEDQLLEQAMNSRPQVLALRRQRIAQEATIRALKGAFGPTLSGTASVTDTGVELGSLVPNGSVGVALNWPLFQGGLTRYQIQEAQANLQSVDAQIDSLRLSVRLDIEQAMLAIRGAKASIESLQEALDNSNERLRLAEGRYASGVGTSIELGDAQIAVTNAAAQLVQGQYNLSVARAQLLTALGRP